MKKFSLVIITSILLASCTEKTQVNVVSGRLFEKCETPLANREIALKANEGGSFNNPIILGSAVSNSDGTFNFTYELEEEANGTGDIILINPTGFKTLLEGLTLNEDAAIELYNQDTATVNVSLEGTKVFSATDTLFLGLNRTGEEFTIVAPSNGSLIDIKTTIKGPLEDSSPIQVYYGLGKQSFNTAKAATGEEGAVQNLTVTVNACMLSDTAQIVIN